MTDHIETNYDCTDDAIDTQQASWPSADSAPHPTAFVTTSVSGLPQGMPFDMSIPFRDGLARTSNRTFTSGTDQTMSQMTSGPRSAASASLDSVGVDVTARNPDLWSYYDTEKGDSERLIAVYGSEIRYCAEQKEFIVWDNGFWKTAASGEFRSLITSMTNVLIESLGELEQAPLNADEATLARLKKAEQERDRRWKVAMRYQNMKKLRDIEQMTMFDKTIAVNLKELDTHSKLLNVLNGTVDLETGELREHHRGDLLTHKLATPYIPEAQCSRWNQFLGELFGSDADMVQYIQRVAGYCLTADASEQCLFIMHGPGGNGKSTFISVLMKLLGELAIATPASTFVAKKFTAAVSNDLARLRGRRMSHIPELAAGQQMDEPLLKSLTGGDEIACRKLFKEFQDIRAVCKLFMTVNERPIINGTDDGIWRRIRLIECSQTVAPENLDPQLLTKLLNELPGILAWAVEGAVEFSKNGLNTPAKVLEHVQSYRADMDAVSQFLSEACERTVERGVETSALHAIFQCWCKQNGHHPLPPNKFRSEIKKAGYEIYKCGNSTWRGLKLRSPENDYQEPTTS